MNAPVQLVGAGPGQADLLTLRAELALGGADLVVADPFVVGLAVHLAPQAALSFAGDPATVAAELAAAAAAGRSAVRLYLGDPWAHPAFAAERDRLQAGGTAWEAVPGLVVEWAAATGAGIPLHHRPRAVTLTTAAVADLPTWPDAARTLVSASDDLAAACAALAGARPGGTGHGALPAVALPAPPGRPAGAAGVVRGRVHELVEAAPPEPGVLVVGAVAG